MNSERRPPLKNLTNFELFQLGINEEAGVVHSMEELRKNPPNIIIAESLKSLSYRQNNFKREQKLVKKAKYIMSVGVYKQLSQHPIDKTKILKPSTLKFKNLYHPYNGEDLTNKTLLIWRQGGIGDLLFISPNLRYLKDKYPTCKIHFACGPQYQSMVREWKFIDKVLDLPFMANNLFEADYHVLFEGVIERTKEAENENAYRLFTKWLGLNLPDELLYPEQEPNEKEVENCRKALDHWNLKEKGFIIIQMKASSPIRTPRPEFWKRVIDDLTSKDQNIILVDSPSKSKDIDNFIKTLAFEHKVFNFSKLSEDISDTIALTSLAKLVIGVDSSLIHIAESLKIRSFGIYGPFPGEIRLSTYKYTDWMNAKSTCSPCFQHGLNLCKHSSSGYVRCFDNINIHELIEKVEKYV